MIKVFDPNIRTEEALSVLRDVFNSGWIGMGEKVQTFEEQMAQYLGCKKFVALNSCTAALHLSIKVLNLPKNSNILVTPVTCPAPNLVALQEHLVPIFYDIDPITGSANVDSIKKLIKENSNISAIILVHIGGYPCDIDEIQQLCDDNNIKIIEDCAHALGSTYKNRKIGNGKNLCCFSFHSLKNLTTGDGGGVATNNIEYAERIKQLSWYGGTKHTYQRLTSTSYTWNYDIHEQGLKYHMNDVTAAIGIVQLQYLDKDNEWREKIAKRYIKELNVLLPTYKNDRTSSYHFLPIHIKNRQEVIDVLNSNDIYPSVHYERNDDYDIFKQYKTKLDGVTQYCETELTLPIHPKLTNNDITLIIDIVNKVAK